MCTPYIAPHFSHLKDISASIPEFDPNSDILLLLDKDVIEVHYVFDQITGSTGTPFAQRLGLGWVVVAELCIGHFHAHDTVNFNKIHLLANGSGAF